MFELTTKNADGWKVIIGLSAELNEEAIINITDKGLDFKVMDESRSGLVDFEWNKENMIDFKCDQDQKIGFRTGDFNKILKRAGNDDIIKMSHSGQGIMTVNIGSNKSYDLRLVETDMIETGATIKATYDNKIIIPSDTLKEKISDVSFIGDFVEIHATDGQISFSVHEDGKKGTTIYKNESIKVLEESKAEYGMSYIENALRAVKGIDISLGVQNKRPLCLELILKDIGQIKYYLAPVQKT